MAIPLPGRFKIARCQIVALNRRNFASVSSNVDGLRWCLLGGEVFMLVFMQAS